MAFPRDVMSTLLRDGTETRSELFITQVLTPFAVAHKSTMNGLGETFAVAGLSGLIGSLLFFTPLWAPQVVFKNLFPTQPQSSASARPTFCLSDGFVLVAFLALANALVTLLRNEMSQGRLIGLAVAGNLLAALIWIRCQQFMRKHEIVNQRSRLLMQTVLYPMSVVVAAELITTALMLLSLLGVFEDGFVSGVNQYVRHPLTTAAATVLALSIFVTFLVRYLFKRYIVLGPLKLHGTHLER